MKHPQDASRPPRRVAIVLALALVSACAIAAPPAPPTAGLPALTQPLLLLGEVHDNPQHHAERLQAFRALLGKGARPALAMEQLDRDRQGAIDALFASGARPGADAVIAAGAPGGGAARPGGWDWPQYRPFIEAALQAGLPIVAANVGREEARRVMREGLATHGFDPAVPADVQAALVQDIVASHCGLIDEPMATRMALAQVARDQFMARVLAQHAERGVVLLAGNGHVRTDVGVPRWLPPALRARSQAVGWLEQAPDAASAAAEARRYDEVRITPVHPRPDPCEGMRKQIPARPAPNTAR